MAAHGVGGEVRVYPHSDFPERFQDLTEVLLGPEARPCQVRFRAFHRGLVLLSIEGCSTRAEAAAMRGTLLYLHKNDLPPLPPGEYYFYQLVGLQVVDTAGAALGRVVAVEHKPAHDLYWVETPAGSRHPIPAVRAIVQEIDLGAGRMVIRPLPGLLE